MRREDLHCVFKVDLDLEEEELEEEEQEGGEERTYTKLSL